MDVGVSLHLFARSAHMVRIFLADELQNSTADIDIIEGYGDFTDFSFDVVINCIGVGTEKNLQGNYARYFTVTEEYDNLVLGYLQRCNPDALYVTFSSGAVYGRSFSAPVSKETANCIKVNHLAPQDYYGIARLNAEAKHRALKELKIVDLRVFSYFSRYVDLSDGYFITDVMDCILRDKVLATSNVNIVRDYVHPDDLYAIVVKCMGAGTINAAFDVASTKPAEKFEILEYFSEQYGLKYSMDNDSDNSSPTGMKNIYCSDYHNAVSIGYVPKFSSMETIIQESGHILKACNR